jgi:putative phosphoesterase
LGDIVGYGPQPNEVIEQLQQLHPAKVLLGNHDHAVITGNVEDFSPHAAEAVEWTRREISQTSRNYLTQLTPSAKLERHGITLAMFHGSPRDPLSEYVYPGLPMSLYRSIMKMADAKVVLLGHTHIPMEYKMEDRMVANPGSVGQPRDGDHRASFAILTISEREVKFELQRVEYDIDAVADRILRRGLPSFLAERLYTGV